MKVASPQSCAPRSLQRLVVRSEGSHQPGWLSLKLVEGGETRVVVQDWGWVENKKGQKLVVVRGSEVVVELLWALVASALC